MKRYALYITEPGKDTKTIQYHDDIKKAERHKELLEVMGYEVNALTINYHVEGVEEGLK